jgi:hypothetical protein
MDTGRDFKIKKQRVPNVGANPFGHLSNNSNFSESVYSKSSSGRTGSPKASKLLTHL